MTQRPIDSWNLLTPAQREAVAQFNQTARPFRTDATLHGLIREQVAKTPDAVALAFPSTNLTYRELDQRSNQFAHLLHKLGVGPNVLVALALDRGPDQYVALLGVLKAGAAYVPIDPNWPSVRLTQVVTQSRAAVLVTTANYLGQMGGLPELRVVTCDLVPVFQRLKKAAGRLFDRDDLDAQSIGTHSDPATPTDLAYVIYTSGSTGVPKGVMVEHRSLVNLTTWVTEAFGVTRVSRVLQNASLHFDASAQQIFPALTTGATLYPVPETLRLDPPRFLEWVRVNRITHWDSVPSLWYAVVEHLTALGEPIALPDLRWVLLAGEPLDRGRLDTWHRHVVPGPRVANIYGPTEATVDCTWHPAPGPGPQAVVPIGRPLANVQIYVLDDAGQHCLPGTEGELCVAGVALARGYMHDPDRTAEAFVERNISGVGLVRVYRTGDIGRLRPDGVLEYVGRRDQQVKIRGQRVELGEVEAALQGIVGPGRVAVVAQGTDENRQLVAYYVPMDESLGQDTITTLAREVLPGGMLPHRFVALPEFPRTGSGKIDRQALAGLTAENPPTTVGPVEHLSPRERVLAEVWQQVLKVSRVGRDEDFFSLGGDSIQIIMLRHRLEQAGIVVSTVDLFRHPTIRSLARFLDQQPVERTILPGQAKSCGVNPAILREQALPLLPSQLGMIYEAALHGLALYMPQIVLRLHGPFDPTVIEQAVNQVVARHDSLRVSMRLGGCAAPVQIVWPKVHCRITIDDKGQRPSEDRDAYRHKYCEREITRVFDLTEPPLFRMSLLRWADDEWELVWTMHHAIIDGWSSALVLQELAHYYSATITHQFQPLPPPPLSLATLVEHRLRRQTEKSRRFHDRYLTNFEPPRLPFDAAENQSREVCRHEFVLGPDSWDGLRRAAQRNAVSVNTVVLAAFLLFLRRVYDRDDVITGVVVSGRDDPPVGLGVSELLSFVGNLAVSLPFRMDLSGLHTFPDLLRAVADRVGELSEYVGLDLGELTRHALPGVGQSLFNTLFVFENYPTLGAEGTQFAGLRVVRTTSTDSNGYPLTLLCSEDAGRLELIFQFASDCFSPDTIRAWSEILVWYLQTAAKG